jgi:glycosyltransferase involved in cell wall biosynthesis
VNFLRFLFRPFRNRSKRNDERFDVYSRRSWKALPDCNGIRLDAWTLADAEHSIEGAARVAAGLLRTHKWIRRRFAYATTEGEGGAYEQWLTSDGAVGLGLFKKAARNLGEAFRAAPGRRVFDLYLHSPEIQKKFPLALLTAGQKSFAKWLTRQGRTKFNLTAGEIIWFLHLAAEKLPEMVLQTWLITPAWQEKFPLERPSAAQGFLQWISQEFAGCPSFSRLKALPAILRRFQESLPLPGNKNGIDGANILSHFCYPSGLQRMGLLTARALEKAGLKVSCRDVPTSPLRDTDVRTGFLGLESFPFTIVNVAPQPYFRSAYELSGLLRRSDVYRIAYWVWELDDIPPQWVKLTPLFDEIWAPTKFVADAFRRRMPTPVHEVLLPVDIGEVAQFPKSELGIAENGYVFLFTFDMCSELIRKNPFAVISAFRSAFPNPEDVTLIIKVSRGRWNREGLAELENASRTPGVVLIDRVISHSQILGLIEMCDCFVSLHRSEGFGLCLAEAMLLGKPVVATNYSGNLSFMHSRNSLLVDYTLTEIIDDNPVYAKGNRWAEPSIEHAASCLRWCYDHPAEAAALGAIGQAEARDKFSLEAAGRRMAARLADCAARAHSTRPVAK